MKIVIFLRNYKTLNAKMSELYNLLKYKFFAICNEIGMNSYIENNEEKYFEKIIYLLDFTYDKIYDSVIVIKNKYPNLPISFISTRDQSVFEVGKLSFEFSLENSNLIQFVDKTIMKNKIKENIRIPKYVSIPENSYNSMYNEEIKNKCKQIGYPLFAKPTSLTSSKFTCKINNDFELNSWMEHLKNYPNIHFEIEEFIEG